MISAGFKRVTALDLSPHAEEIARGLPQEQVTFILSRFEDFRFPEGFYDLVNAEFCLPFTQLEYFAKTFNDILGSVKSGGIFTGQLFGPHDTWNVENSGMSFHTRAEAREFFYGFELLEFTEEDHQGMTKLGEAKHWHIFHIIARKKQGSLLSSG